MDEDTRGRGRENPQNIITQNRDGRTSLSHREQEQKKNIKKILTLRTRTEREQKTLKSRTQSILR